MCTCTHITGTEGGTFLYIKNHAMAHQKNVIRVLSGIQVAAVALIKHSDSFSRYSNVAIALTLTFRDLTHRGDTNYLCQ